MKQFRTILITLFVVVFGQQSMAGGETQTAVMQFSVKQPFEQAYKSLYQALEEARFYVIFEANIGKNLARNAERWGENYNRNQFEDMKSLVICNPWYANEVINLDPSYMAMCPLTVGVVHKQGVTTVYFRRLVESTSGEVNDLLWEVENTIVSAIESVTEQTN